MDKMGSARSYSAGTSAPWKLLRSRTAVQDGRIAPEHIRLYPTNRCNAKCSFCEFRNWTRDEEFSTEELLDVVRHFHSLGTRAITLSGGGEPTLHPGLDALLDLCRELDVHAGLITNGLLWSDKEKNLPARGKLIWARLSIIDSESGKYDIERLRRFCRNLSGTPVGCYATVSKKTDIPFIQKLAELAENLDGVTHFKLGEDSIGLAPGKMDELEKMLVPAFSKVIVSRHSRAAAGMKRCLVSLLRPVIAPDGFVYPCCNMETDEGHVKPVMFRMGHWRDFGPGTKPFDGSICPKCIWEHYNKTLENLTEPLEHERFL